LAWKHLLYRTLKGYHAPHHDARASLIDAAGRERWAQLIAEVLTAVLADPAVHEVVYY